jgi:hypothetical protein
MARCSIRRVHPAAFENIRRRQVMYWFAMCLSRVGILLFFVAAAAAHEFSVDSCKSPFLAFSPPNPSAPRNLDDARADVVAYYENGSYDRDMDAAHEQARLFFDSISPPLNATVVFDIDETSLSNYESIKEQDFGCVPL